MKEIIVVLLSTFKFGMTFPLAVITFRFGFLETLLWTNLGGTIGIFFFAYLSEGLIKLWKHFLFASTKQKTGHSKDRRKVRRKPVFTRRNRRIVALKAKYGLPGIALATPILLSIPVGVFIVVRYFGKKNSRFAYLIGGNFIWSLIYTTFYGYSLYFAKELMALL